MANKNVEVTINFKNGSISDNEGNKIEQGDFLVKGLGSLPKITCDGKEQEISPEGLEKFLPAKATGTKSLDQSNNNGTGNAIEGDKSNPNKIDFWKFNNFSANPSEYDGKGNREIATIDAANLWKSMEQDVKEATVAQAIILAPKLLKELPKYSTFATENVTSLAEGMTSPLKEFCTLGKETGMLK